MKGLACAVISLVIFTSVVDMQIFPCISEMGYKKDENGIICSSHTGSDGRCKLIEDCPAVKYALRRGLRPVLCNSGADSFTEFCCPSSEKSGKVEIMGQKSCKSGDEDGVCTLLSDCPGAKHSKVDDDMDFCCYDEIKREPAVCCVPKKTENSPLETRSRSNFPSLPEISGFSTRMLKRKADAFCQFYIDAREDLLHTLDGDIASRYPYPHMVALGEKSSDKFSYVCSGSLINEKYILTAAHCFKRKVTTVLLGMLSLQNATDEPYMQEIEISQIILHTKYLPRSHYNDIALVKLAKEPNMTVATWPACLNTMPLIENVEPTATGWARNDALGSINQLIVETKLGILNESACTSAYVANKMLADGINGTTQLCAASRDKVQNACQDHAGGPLQVGIVDTPHGSNIIGVASFGNICGTPEHSGVYTKIEHYVPWIVRRIWTSNFD